MRIPIDEVVHFDVVTHNPATAAISDADSTPTFDVYEEATDTGLLGATNLTKRTSLTGNYRGTFTASAANGFEAGKWYSVVVSATVNSVAAKNVPLRFTIVPAESSAGVAKVDLSHWLGTAAATPNTAGVPKADLVLWLGTAPLALSSQRVQVLTAAISAGLIDSTAAPNLDAAISSRAVAGDAMALTSGERTTLAAVIWNSLTSGMSTVGSIGKKLADWVVGTIDTYTGNTKQTGDAFARLGAPAGASTAADIAAVKTDTGNLVTRITATLFSGITSLAQWLGLLGGKQSGDETARTELRATGGGSGTFDETTDSLEASRDNVGAAGAGLSAVPDLAGVTTLLSRLSAARAALLDQLDPAVGGTAAAEIDVLIARLTSARAGYLDNLSAGAVALASVCTEARLAELGAANIPADVDTLLARLTSARAGYLDNLSGGAVALASALATAQTDITSILAKANLLPEAPAKNTALAYVIRMKDADDAALTGLTITGRRTLDGAALASMTGTITELTLGLYKVEASAADMNGTTVGHLFTATGAKDLLVEFHTTA